MSEATISFKKYKDNVLYKGVPSRSKTLELDSFAVQNHASVRSTVA
jgi:hypothetical protein